MGIEMPSSEGTLQAIQCVNCGAIFGETLIDFHHRLPNPPAPRMEANPHMKTPPAAHFEE